MTSSIFNYSTNKKLVFKNEDELAKTGMGHFGLAVGLFVLDAASYSCLFYAVFGMNLLIVKIIVGILLLLFLGPFKKNSFLRKGHQLYYEIFKRNDILMLQL